jgi:hypothetical protein
MNQERSLSKLAAQGLPILSLSFAFSFPVKTNYISETYPKKKSNLFSTGFFIATLTRMIWSASTEAKVLSSGRGYHSSGSFLFLQDRKEWYSITAVATTLKALKNTSPAEVTGPMQRQ